MSGAANKVKFNIKNVHYAKATVTDGLITYATPVPIPGAVSLSFSPTGETTPFFAEGEEYWEAVSNRGYEGELEIALVPESFLIDILGETLTPIDKVLVENAKASVSPFALLFEFDGDVKSTRHVMFNAIATRPNLESKTTTTSKEPTPDKLSIKCRPRRDGRIKTKTTAATPEAVYNAWYTKVWENDGGVA